MLNQIVDGLRCFGTYDLLKQHPGVLNPVFVQCGCFILKPEEFLESVTGIFSETGSNNRQREIDIFKFFHDYVENELGKDDAGNLNYLLLTIGHLHGNIQRIPQDSICKRGHCR
jgi:hypothetical protein